MSGIVLLSTDADGSSSLSRQFSFPPSDPIPTVHDEGPTRAEQALFALRQTHHSLLMPVENRTRAKSECNLSNKIAAADSK